MLYKMPLFLIIFSIKFKCLLYTDCFGMQSHVKHSNCSHSLLVQIPLNIPHFSYMSDYRLLCWLVDLVKVQIIFIEITFDQLITFIQIILYLSSHLQILLRTTKCADNRNFAKSANCGTI